MRSRRNEKECRKRKGYGKNHCIKQKSLPNCNKSLTDFKRRSRVFERGIIPAKSENKSGANMLKVDNLTFEVNEEGRKRCLVNHISFEVKDGKMLVITGPNGGGKSTLAKVLAGIEDANGGEIFLDEENITGYDIDHRANAGIGYAFQQPPRFKGMTVKKMLSLAAGKELTEAESCKLLSAVGLCSADYLNRQMDGTLSGGEMKRLEIATVLAKPHKVSIFDEPEAGIDLWSFSMLIRRFEEIHKEKRECLILISHQERIIQMADKIMVIEDGQVKEYGTKEDVLPTLFQQKTGRMCGQEGGTC